MSTYATSAEHDIMEEIREGILDGTLIPATRDDCVVCDDLGNDVCPHTEGAEE